MNWQSRLGKRVILPIKWHYRSKPNKETTRNMEALIFAIGLLNRIIKFFASFVTGAERRSDPATNLSRPKTSSLSSVTTPSGPWVYTVVPWED